MRPIDSIRQSPRPTELTMQKVEAQQRAERPEKKMPNEPTQSTQRSPEVEQQTAVQKTKGARVDVRV